MTILTILTGGGLNMAKIHIVTKGGYKWAFTSREHHRLYVAYAQGKGPFAPVPLNLTTQARDSAMRLRAHKKGGY